MSLSSPLSQIINVLTETDALAQQYKELLQQNAQATQAVLVEPVLRALGWNCNDPRYVRRNLVFQDLELDYALYDGEGTICSLIKVIALDEDLYSEQLHEPLQVLAEYQDIDYVILVNGSAWQFLRPSEEGFLEFFSEIDCQAIKAEQSAQRLITLLDICHFWRFQQPDYLIRLYQLVDQLQNELNLVRQTNLELSQKEAKTLPPTELAIEPSASEQEAKQQALGRRRKHTIEDDQAEQTIDTANLKFIPLEKLGHILGEKPQALRLPTGELIPIRSWKELLVACCALTLEHNQNLAIPLADSGGRRTQLIDTVPPKQGRSFEQLEYRGRTVYIYTNYDSLRHVQNSLHILEYLPAEFKQVEPAIALRD